MVIKERLRKERWPVDVIKGGRCPKCQGILTLDFDSKVGFCVSCLNCGNEDYLGKSLSRLVPRKYGDQ